MADRKGRIIPPGNYDAKVVDLGSHPDGASAALLSVLLELTRAHDAGGKPWVHRQVLMELVLDADGEPGEAMGRDRLVRWASWITSRGWLCGTA